MDGNHFKAKKTQVLPVHILTRCLKKTQVSEGGGRGREQDGGRTQEKEHLFSSTYPSVVTFFHKTGQTKMKEKMEPDKKDI